MGLIVIRNLIFSWQRINPTQCSSASTPSPPSDYTNFEHYLSVLPQFSNEDFFSYASSSSEYYLSSAFSYFPYYYLLLNPLDDDGEAEDDKKSKKKQRKRQRVVVLLVEYPVLSHPLYAYNPEFLVYLTTTAQRLL